MTESEITLNTRPLHIEYYGFIIDVKGKPIKNATVSLCGDIQLQPVKTDHTGSYRFDIPAEKKGSELIVYVKHSDYLTSKRRLLLTESQDFDEIRLNYTAAALIYGTSEQVYKFAMICSLLICIFAVHLILNEFKGKESFSSKDGKINYLKNKHPTLTWFNRGPDEFRYLKIDTYSHVFTIFVGKDSEDFRPKYEQIDHLKTGDDIKIYYDIIGNDVRFIDKGNVSFFEKGTYAIGKKLALLFIPIGIVLFVHVMRRFEKM
ncbi:MAG: hypothetical protein GY795_23795 [Desulfobacterales bacterium]|nr:hypothetical protein [Desulfobacterales bacterium]